MTRPSPLSRPMSRRSLLQLSALGLAGGGLFLPSRVASAGGPERRFLFVLAKGGWDTTFVYTPSQHNPLINCEPDADVAEEGGVVFVDHASRPAVRTFFERWAPSTAVLNGIEVRSVTHDRCQRILMTGSSAAGHDDWAATIAARSTQDPLLPHLVVYGPAYTARYTDRVVRVGSNGQLRDLLDGTALTQSGVPTLATAADLDALVDARVRGRTAAWAAGAGRGHGTSVGNGYVRALDTLAQMGDIAGRVSLAPEDAGCARDLAADAAAAFDCFSLGLSRCALIEDDGWCSTGWDTHSGNDMQATHYELLFGYLSRIMDDLATRSSVTGGALADEVTVVVMSEMGRHPQLNTTGGKDHWTYTSAMLLGAGVRGGQVIGEMNADFQGRPIDLDTGEPSEAGTGLVPSHLGATLLAMADIDPDEVIVDGAQPIHAVIA
jgi:uncharacterized protein (DUF1501 family)